MLEEYGALAAYAEAIMLRFTDSRSLASGLGRRDFLRVGSLGLAGLGLSDLMAASQKKLLKDKSVIFLFMHGGPSQLETFDPKMTAPSEVRSVTGEIKTALASLGDPRARELESRVSQLLEASFRSGRFAQI